MLMNLTSDSSGKKDIVHPKGLKFERLCVQGVCELSKCLESMNLHDNILKK